MRKKTLALTAACAIAVTTALPLGTASGAEALSKEVVRTQAGTGLPRLEVGRLTAPSKQAVNNILYSYLDAQKTQYGFSGKAKDDFAVLQTVALKGTAKKVLHVQQKYKGIPVYGYAPFVHVNNDGVITGIAGTVAPSAQWQLSVAPKLTSKQAVAAAEKDAALQDAASTSQLVIYYDKATPKLAYAVTTKGVKSGPARWRYLVDAGTGTILRKTNLLNYASEPVNGKGTGVLGDTKALKLTKRFDQYYMQDMTRGQGLYTYDGQLGVSTIPSKLYVGKKSSFTKSYDRAAVDAHAYTGMAYDYFTGVLGDIGLDMVPEGEASLRTIVHYGTDFNNAFWDGASIVFGDGDDTEYTSLSGALDIVGHEMTHAIIERLVMLMPEGETAAIGESLGDFFGTMVEFNKGKNADWEMGEDVYTPGTPNDAARSLANPEKYGQPSHYFQRNLMFDGDVHANSGIISKALYLLSEGGTQREVTVKGIGKDKAAQVVYNALFYLMSDADFLDFKNAIVQSATDLYGADSKEVRAAKRAFQAVGVQGPNDIKKLELRQPYSGTTEEQSEVRWYSLNAGAAAKQGSHVRFTLEGVPANVTVFKSRQQAEENVSEYQAMPDETGKTVVDFPIAWKSTYLVKVEFQEAGAYTLSNEVVQLEPQAAPEECVIEEASKSVTSYKDTLPTMRKFRDNILAKSEAGRAVTNTYYEVSKQLIDDMILDSSFRKDALAYVTQLQPMLKGITTADTGLKRKATKQEWTAITGLKQLIQTHVSAELRAKTDKLWTDLKVDELQSKTIYQWAQERGWLAAPVEILYKAKDTATKTKAVQAASAQGATVKAVTQLPDTFKVTVAASKAQAVKQQLAATKGVSAVTENKAYKALTTDVQYKYQWPLQNDGQTGGTAQADVGFTQLAPLVKGKPQAPVTVAVIDTGVAYDLADLQDRVFTTGDYDFVNQDEDAYDDNGHGTHVSGIIAAQADNGYSMSGISATAKILPLKVLDATGAGTTESIAAAIRYAVDQQVKVINMSLGGPGTDPLIEEQLAYAASKGVTVIVASGNDGAEQLSYPASSQYVISVGATDASDQLADFSNYGEGLDIVAPGADIPSLMPNGQVQLMSGTSMATPYVAGAAAVLYSLDPWLTRERVEELLKQADDLEEPGYDTRTGYGRLDVSRSVAALLKK